MPRKPSRSAEVAAKIDAHLRRFESDPEINIRMRYDPVTGSWVRVPPGNREGIGRYYCAGACAAGGWVRVVYVSYQGSVSLSVADAEAYLAWLDAGGVGAHFEQQRQARPAAP